MVISEIFLRLYQLHCGRRILRRVRNTICNLLRANLSDWSASLFSQKDHFNYPALLHVLEPLLDTGKATGLEMDLVRLDLARGKDLGKQIDIPFALRLLEAHEQKPH